MFARVEKAVLASRRMTPLIVDWNTDLLLDGHHRRAVAISLGLDRVPALLVDYRESSVKVGKWYRNVSNPQVARQLMRANSSRGKWCARLGRVEMCGSSSYILFWRLHWVERFLSTLNVRVVKVVERGELEPPSLSKEDVISVARKGLVFPPKTTRHVYDFIIQHDPVPIT
ncbi:hypothetical protein HS1genome_2294 [Sulfodiicoccus acidiphilus]|uniref:ParB/Sulfiredoxin domain-containing protein n=1 Tax=Sulfodiicoccus acidiphilus TaxID=1670455 RepID=A0A348B6V3_9CREN|nr:chromosome partitioning protein ParB [Sulfodiicoccus acidiphilus]BBD73905.1 hypothetical protein HS1genome_2294 [Sulfodiicoccus acidiphilus]GGT95967.1 hypothetical protein GCM10007116_11830 [Sulfodiicoccus acidiphilus]